MNEQYNKDIIDILAEYVEGDEKMHRVADRMGVPYSTLMRKLNRHDRYQLNVTEIIPFIHASGNDLLIRHLCARLEILAIPMGAHDGKDIDVQAVAEFAKESAEAMASMSQALMDKKITIKEARRCKRELMELVQCAWALLKRFEEVESDGR